MGIFKDIKQMKDAVAGAPGMIEQACRDADVPQPAELASQLVLIVEGATTLAYATGDRHRAAASARVVASAVLHEAGVEAAA